MLKNNRRLLVIAAVTLVGALGYGIVIPILYPYSVKYGLSDFQNGIFHLTAKQTTCLAQDHCGIPADKMQPVVGEWKSKETSCCSPESGCC